MNLLQQLTANHSRSPLYREDTPHVLAGAPPVRLIAYYLPQYHAIPENDAWWGRGFTEWTNVSRGLPRYEGHYQPHLPGELGFYDLRQPSILERQAELVRRYGIAGLCFHHYWFGGKPLLDTPIRILLAHPGIDLPFCVNWANENWSRRWEEGRDHEILIEQVHTPEDDLAFAASLEPLFRDPRYIHVAGRPLLMVYRPQLFPDARETIGRWREHFGRAGLPDPYIVMAQAFNQADPRCYGIDATAGFPPHASGFNVPPMTDEFALFDPEFKGRVVRYADMAAAALAHRPTDIVHHPGVCPSWDNEARKPGRGFSVHGATPTAYGEWLSAACGIALMDPEPERRIVFINAWNEWGEGTHLEPDRHFGYAWLVETSRVLATLDPSAPPPALPAPAAERRRMLRDWPGLIVKNVAFQGAIAAEALAALLRRFV
jgi:hypothetical protein